VRRNLVFFAIAWALVLLLLASCATKNGRVFLGGGWDGPEVTGVTINPATGPYYPGDSVTFTVAATATGGGVLSYSWNFGTWATVTSGGTTASAVVTLVGPPSTTAYSGTVTVTETAEGTSLSKDASFTLLIEVIPNVAPVIDSLTASGYDITAVFHDDDGDDISVEWSSDVGSVTPGTADNTGATATFVPPAGETGTAVVTLTINDGVNADVSDTVSIDYAFDPFEGAVTDSLFFVVASATDTQVVLNFYINQNANPLANINSIRLLCSAAPSAGTFATPTDATPGGNYWKNHSGAFLPPPIIPTPTSAYTGFTTFVDLGMNWGGNTFEASGASAMGCIGILTLTFASGGTGVNFSLSNESNRTYYSDLSTAQYQWATLGKPGYPNTGGA
jgi:hypothetical protein